jgi:acetyltransferase-like isoleucine patch superfamily enzyme
MPDPEILAERVAIAPDCSFGQGVRIEAEEIEIGPGCRIGFSDADDFRTPPGVQIKVRRLVLGRGTQIGRAVRLEGGELRLDDGVVVRRDATIRVTDVLQVGAHGTIGEGCEISGRDVEIGQELWMLPEARIGGGSAYERTSRFQAGHYLHLGVQTFINTARPVVIGHEVGLGTRTAIYTHGAYPSQLMGFPVAFASVQIGDFSWLPGAIVNPGVSIGRNCVIGVNSLVTRRIPDGSLAAGSPARVIKEQAYPRRLTERERREVFEEFLGRYLALLGLPGKPEASGSESLVVGDGGDALYCGYAGPPETASQALADLEERFGSRRVLIVGDGVAGGSVLGAWTRFDTDRRSIDGVADGLSERFSNELRRYGTRFYSRPEGARYADWEAVPPAFEGLTTPGPGLD